LLTPVHDGLTAAVVAAVPTAVSIVVGKPHPFTIEKALKHLGKEETAMIGDQIATDIVAGQSAGLRAIPIACDVPFNALADAVPSLLDLVGATLEETGVA
jgi:4-nitrophenyl phosphatase